MSQFILALHEQPGQLADASPETIQAVIARYVAWREDLGAKGLIAGGNKLCDEGGRWLAANGEGVLVSDGPYSEAKELMTGYFLINAEDYDGAVALAKTCPHLENGRIEVREIEEL